VEGELTAGLHAAIWDGRDENGRTVASGTYLLKLETENFRAVQKVLLVR